MESEHSQTRWWQPLILLAMAALVFVAGAVYGVVMVGVPTPHATPAIATAEARDFSISDRIMLSGIVIGFVAVVWLGILIWICQRRAAPHRIGG